jgi:nicotinate-nucleotide--dimethylbenzimidazole phosphoribosyltransferase
MSLSEIISGIERVDKDFIEQARRRTGQLVMPQRALGELHVIGERLCGIQRTLTPSVNKKAFLVMAGDHGIAGSGVSAYPQVVTGEMLKTFLRGGAGINVLSRQIGAQVIVMDTGIIPDVPPQTSEDNRLIVRKIARGTEDFSKGPAMTKDQAESAILKGYEAAKELFEEGLEILGTGDMGIGNTSPSSAIGAVITRTPMERMTGRGTGIDDSGLQRKCETIKKGIEINNPKPEDPLDVLSKVGGFEIGAIATGAALAMYIIEAGARIIKEVLTFEEAEVSKDK